jgi:hypothetical protein
MTDLLAIPNPFPVVLLDSLRKRFPFYSRGTPAGAMKALRGALDRLTQGELDGRPLSAEAAAAFLRGKIELARAEFGSRDKKYVPHFQSWLNGRRYLATTPADTPKNLEEAVSILACYPTVIAVDVQAHIAVLQVIDQLIEFTRATHGVAAASYIRQRVMRYRELVSRWPSEELQFVPSPLKFFRERRHENDERFWQRTPKNGYESERSQLARLVQ